VLIGAYVFLQRRRKKVAMRFPHLAIIKQAIDGQSKIKRHIPPALLLASLTLLIVAIARPSAIVTVASQGGTIIMAIDVSASMRAADVSPDRITAAQVAAKALINDRAHQIRIGIVKFSGSAFPVQSPTADTVALNAAIDNLRPQFNTAIGDAVYASLQMIFPQMRLDSMIPGMGGNEFVSIGDSKTRSNANQPARPALTPVPPGSYRSAAIILMTDGKNTAGPDPIEAARLAANLGVRIFTIGFGSPTGQILNYDGGSSNSVLDEDTLKRMAEITKAQYFHAQSAQELTKIYKQLTTTIQKEPQETEITVFLVAAAVAFCTLSSFLSMLWFYRIF
jgi:Ca-activated chloride channel family protein